MGEVENGNLGLDWRRDVRILWLGMLKRLEGFVIGS